MHLKNYEVNGENDKIWDKNTRRKRKAKNVKCSCHTNRGESKTTITCGCQRPQQKYIDMIRDENYEENYEGNGENDKDNCEEES